jgi:uncharacterized protein with HEPN domain
LTREYKLFIYDIFEAIGAIEDFVRGKDYKDFLEDEKTMSAVVWKIHIIGEAAKNLPKSITAKYKNVPWKYMARMRDKVAHLYFGIDYEIVWQVIKERLPGIKLSIEEIFKELELEK